MKITEVTYTNTKEVEQFFNDLQSLTEHSFALKYEELKVLNLKNV